MKYGLLYHYWSDGWSCDYIETAKKIKNAGFDVMEIGGDHLGKMSAQEMDSLKATVQDLGLELSVNIGPARDQDLASEDKATRERGVAYLSDILRRMDRIGSKMMIGALYTYWPADFSIENDKERAWELSINSLRELAKVAEDLGATCSLEILNRYEGYILNTCEEGLAYLKRIGSPNIKLLLDTFHMSIDEDSLPGAIRLAGDRLGHMHLGEGNRKVPGLGSMPWAEIGRALRDINFNGFAVIEPFMRYGGQIAKDVHLWHDFFPDATGADMDRMLTDSLAFLKQNFEA